MTQEYQVRWISKQQLDTLRKSRAVTQGIVLDSFNGFLIVEPLGSNLGDGNILSHEEAEYELTPVWCTGPKTKLFQARKLLGLATGSPTEGVEARELAAVS